MLATPARSQPQPGIVRVQHSVRSADTAAGPLDAHLYAAGGAATAADSDDPAAARTRRRAAADGLSAAPAVCVPGRRLCHPVVDVRTVGEPGAAEIVW